jgi:WD40 repeat protein
MPIFGKTNPEQQSLLSRMFLALRLKYKPKTVNIPEPTLPSGLTVKEATRMCAAIVECVQQARRTNQPVVFDLVLDDFEISHSDTGAAEAQLRPASAERTFQSPAQDQMALGRLIYQLVSGHTLLALATSTTVNQALKQLAEPTYNYAEPNRPLYPELALIIQRAMQREFNSLNELNGAFGWALYCDGQNRQAFRGPQLHPQFETNTANMQNATPKVAEKEKSEHRVGFTLRRNVWILLALIGLNILAIAALVTVLNNSELFKNTSAKQIKEAVAVTDALPPTFTPSLSDTQQNQNDNPSTSSSVGVGAQQDIIDVPSLIANTNASSTSLNSNSANRLLVGQAALWNPPLVTVNSYNWIDPDNGVVGIATDDGRYSIYSKEGLSNPVNVASALKDGMISACFSPDGNRYAALLTNQQVLLNDSERNLQLQIPLSQINNFGGGRSNFQQGNPVGGNRGGAGFGNGFFGYTNPCSQLFSWSPDSQKLLLMSRSLKLYSFDDTGIQAIQPTNPILNATADRVIWEPDGARIGIFEGATIAGNSNQAPKIFNYYNASNLELINSVAIDTPTGAFLTANQALWSPNKHQIARVFFYNTEQSSLTMTLQIFNLPSQQGSLDKPVPAELAQNNSLNFGAGFYPNLTLAWSSTGTDLAIYQAHLQTTTAKPANNNAAAAGSNDAGIEGEISIFKVGANGKLTNTAKFSTGSYDIASLSWNPTDKELLSVDNAGNLKLWEETTQQPSSTPKSTNLNTPIIANSLFLKLTRFVGSRTTSPISWSPDGSFLAQQNGSIVSILDGKTGQFKFNISSPISIEVQPNVNPGKWSADGQFFAMDALMLNVDENVIGVWKAGAKEFTFVGAIRYQNNTTNNPTNFNFGRNGGGLTREETWSFALDRNAILVAMTSTSNSNDYILQYDLSKPLPPVEEQITFDPALEITNQPNSSNSNTQQTYTIVGAVGSSSAATITTLVAWSPKQDQLLFRSLRYYSLFKLIKPAPTQTPFPVQTPITLTLVPQNVQTFAPPIKVVFSPDGKLIAFGLRNGTVKIFSSENGKPLTSLIASNAELTDLEFSPDGQWLATSTNDRSVKIWQVSNNSSWKLLQVLRGFIKPVSSLNFTPQNPNGQYLLTVDTSGLSLMWRLS